MRNLLRYLKDYKKESVLGPLFKLLEAIVNAITIAPKTIKGERKNSLKTKLTPDCT